jgi:hypothetical protein
MPTEAAITAAARILATSPNRRKASVNVHPATVHRVDGHLVAVYHFDDGEVVDAECSCSSKGLCEHLLVALAPADPRHGVSA